MSEINYDIQIIDNFLPEDEARAISDHMIGPEAQFPWFYNHAVVNYHEREEDDIHNHQFTHIFYNNWSPTSSFNLILPIAMKLNPIGWQRIKANLNPVTSKKVQYAYHTDFQAENVPCAKTAIYYLNTNNGVTIFKDGTQVESVFNRMVIFDQRIPHTGTTCTDQKVKSLINFNFIERE